MRRLAPELLVTAKTQRWNPEEFLRTLVEAEIAARDASNAAPGCAGRVPGDQDARRVRPGRLLDPRGDVRLPRLPGVDPRRGERLLDRAGRHRQVPPPDRARRRRRRRRAPGAVLHRRRTGRDPLPRPGRQHRRQGHRHPAAQRPDHLSTSSASPRSTTPAPNCCSGSSPPPTNAAPSASARTGPSSPGAGSCPSTPPPSACSTGSSTTATSSSPTAKAYCMRQARNQGGTKINKR